MFFDFSIMDFVDILLVAALLYYFYLYSTVDFCLACVRDAPFGLYLRSDDERGSARPHYNIPRGNKEIF